MLDKKLIELLKKVRNHCIDTNIDLELLWPRLIMNEHLTQDEIDLIYSNQNITHTAKKVKTFDLLQSKDETVFQTLHYLFKSSGWKDALNILVEDLCGTPYGYLTEEHAVIFKEDKSLKTSWDNLKVHYKERLELVESYWGQFGITGCLNMESFYNHNIVISNEKYKQIQKKIENFDNLFSTDYKRIIVMAEAGYGKSTFVHEMARQWVKGDEDWTKKFKFLFLFRLTEVNENESKSLENLLSQCLLANDASKVYNWLLKDGNMSKALFIFDGLDELRQNFCQEVNKIIFGGKVNLETVVITSRQCDKLTEIKKDKQRKLYFELKGYSNKGVIQQLEKFNIPVDGMKKELKNHLKIPLFNTIFCITHSASTNSLVCTSISSSIHSFVNFAINRYRNSNQHFTESCEEELLLTLGQAAQNKFSFIEGFEISYPNVLKDHLSWAMKSGLLHDGSLKEELVFAHQTIAEFCAAYYWCKKTNNQLVINKCYIEYVELTEPKYGRLKIVEPFCQFLCLLSPKFKEDLWLSFGWYVPICNEYESLPDKLHTEWNLCFSSHSVDDQFTIMNKLRFQEDKKLTLDNGQFDPEKLFKTIRKLKELDLFNCTFNIGAENFFLHFINVQSLTFRGCKFYDLKKVPNSGESNPSHLPQLHLQKLNISRCLGIETFLSFIMKHFTLMKSFELKVNVISDCGFGWINELKNNKGLCDSIEDFRLSVHDKLTKSEANALADLLKIGLHGLKNITLHIQMENQEDYEPILKNLSKHSALTSLHLWNKPFTTNTLNYLADIFNKLKLEKCELEYQEIFFEERIINSINSCLSLENIRFPSITIWDSNFEFFTMGLGNKDRRLRIILKDREFIVYFD